MKAPSAPWCRAWLCCLATILTPQFSNLFAQGTAFTYQGRLTDSASPANGMYDLRFILYTADAGGSQAGPILTNAATPVSGGVFTVMLDFGAILNGSNYWMEIAVRTNGAGSFITLSPRQQLTPTPYAVFAEAVGTNGLAGTFPNALALNNAANQFNGSFSGNGAGLTSVNASTLGGLNTSNFWKTGGNAGSTPGINFLGTTDNQPLELKVSSTRALRLEPNPNGAPNVIGGAPGNFVALGIYGATIAGGGSVNTPGSSTTNRVIGAGNFGTVGGGNNNTSSELNATVAGGTLNTASGGASTIGGGQNNSSTFYYTTVAGGANNISSGESAAVGGGYQNKSTGARAIVAGGFQNTSSGDYSTISGGQNNTSSNNFSTVSGGFQNASSATGATVGGGYQNTNGGTYATVGGGFQNTSSSNYATIAGGGGNTASFQFATVAGGVSNTSSNRYSTVGGGFLNISGSDSSTVSGGQENHSTGPGGSTVGGGYLNNSTGFRATVGGGQGNTSSGPDSSTVGGGLSNSATNSYATVPGGSGNLAGGQFSFAAGHDARALHDGSFVWADSPTGGFASTGNDQFLIRASGGVGLGTPNPAAKLHLYSTDNPTTFRIQSTGTPGFGRIEFVSNPQGDAFEWRPAYIQSLDAGGFTGGLGFYLNGTGVANRFTANEVMRLVNGNVGIGTTNPAQLLQIGDVNAPASQGMVRLASRSGTGAESRYWDIGVPQGNANTAGKFYSFVIDDPQLGTAPELLIRWDTGFVGIGKTNPASALDVNGTVTATAFNPPSDRNLKENLTPVSPREVLDKVAAIPISRWNFKSDSATTHVGPMAQDFYAAFAVGTDDKHIATVDADGVALAAIQGLNQKVEEQRAELARRDARVAALEQRLAVMESKLSDKPKNE